MEGVKSDVVELISHSHTKKANVARNLEELSFELKLKEVEKAYDGAKAKSK